MDRSAASRRSLGQRTTWLAIILAAGFSLPAKAQIFWPNSPGDRFLDEPQRIEHRRPRVVRNRIPKLPDAPRDTAKPKGPIVIAISVDNQQLKIYDANGLFAESPVSTGMRGHSTPMGVFSIIQKNKWHRSNIYSGAPMPYMQRITWSGIALHAGALPGYPASHGCVRMPTNFAMRLWGWTRMGARVVITPGEVSPSDVSSAHLIARKADVKAAGASNAVPEARQDLATTDKTVTTEGADSLALAERELRLTPIADKAEPVRTADAGGPGVKMSDAGNEEPAKRSDQNPSEMPKGEAVRGNSDNSTSSGDKPADGQVKSEEPKGDKDQTRATIPVAPVSLATPRDETMDFIGPVKPRTGHVAAYVSRKDNKLYVRQNFEPWFEVPVTIAAPDRPLGTHIFTARADKDDSDIFRWSVVSLPTPLRAASRADDDMPQRRKKAVEVSVPLLPSSAAEALDRVTIPDNAMKKIASTLAPGGSLIISDYGLGDETGRGTDFIVPLR